MVAEMVKLRKGKMTDEQVRAALSKSNYFGTMLVKMGGADCLLGGATYSTADTVRPALQLIKTKPGNNIVSSCFILVRGDEKIAMGDCAINIDPSEDDLVEIAIESAKTMETVQIGISGMRHQPVFMDKNASEADGIILFNRIKPHTSFRGPYESGLMKMMAIGLGKQKGAESIHHQSPAIMHELVEEYGRTILENAPVLGGIAIIENAYDDTYLIKGLSPEEIISEEPKLKEISYKTIAHLLFDKCDVLVVDKIGKNISGDGMDPNVSGRFVQPKYCSGGIQAEKCVILDLTDETHGNAQGIGLAEVTTRRLFNKMKLEMTYPTGVTNTFLHLMKIPMIMDNDREALQLALMCCPEAEDHDHMKMIRIPNTAHIGVIEISEGMLPLVENNPNFEVLTEPYDLPFDENGNLF